VIFLKGCLRGKEWKTDATQGIRKMELRQWYFLAIICRLYFSTFAQSALAG
jgi:hypothetical protein